MRDAFYDDLDRLRREELAAVARGRIRDDPDRDRDDPDEDDDGDDDFDDCYLEGGTMDEPQDEDGSKPFYPPWPSTEDDIHRVRIAE